MKVVYDVPKEVRLAIEPHIEASKWLAPLWLDRLAVSWKDPDKPTDALSTVPQPEYAYAELFVHPAFMGMTTENRRSIVRHEFIHQSYERVCEVFDSLLKATTDEGDPLRIWAEEAHRLAMEACVTDLELGLGRLLDSPNGERA